MWKGIIQMRAKAWIAIGILLIAVGVGVAVLISMASEKAEQPIRTEEKKENQNCWWRGY